MTLTNTGQEKKVRYRTVCPFVDISLRASFYSAPRFSKEIRARKFAWPLKRHTVLYRLKVWKFSSQDSPWPFSTSYLFSPQFRSRCRSHRRCFSQGFHLLRSDSQYIILTFIVIKYFVDTKLYERSTIRLFVPVKSIKSLHSSWSGMWKSLLAREKF